MKKLKVSLFVLLLTAALIPFSMSPSKAEAAFDRASIIDDSVFPAYSTMSEAQIRQFMLDHGSRLVNVNPALDYKIPASHNQTYNWYNSSTGNYEPRTYWENSYIGPIGAEVDATGWNVPHVIYMASQWYKLNPQVILATLQKESSAVTNPSMGNITQQWAMGYAYTDSGIVSACDTATNHNPTGSCAGIAMQIDWGSGMLKAGYNRGMKGTLVNIDGYSFNVTTHSAWVLYQYTPHISGNLHFYNIYSAWFNPGEVITSSLPVVTSLGFSDLSPVAGQTLNIGFAIKNTTTSPLTVNIGVADQNTGTGQWNSFSPQNNVTFAAGETKNFSFTKQVLYPGQHWTRISIGYQGIWYDAEPLTNQLVDYSYYVRPANNLASVSASLGFSDLSPAAGQSLNAVYTIKNNSSSNITIEAGLADQNLTTGQWNSFSSQTVTISGYGQRQVSFTKKVMYPGLHRTWIAFGIGGVWYDAKPISSQSTSYTYYVRVPNIRLNAYAFDTLPPKANQKFNGYLTITNMEPKAITIDAVGVPIYNNFTGAWKTMIATANNVVLNPGQKYSLAVYQTLATGNYNIWPSICVTTYCYTPKTAENLEMWWSGYIN